MPILRESADLLRRHKSYFLLLLFGFLGGFALLVLPDAPGTVTQQPAPGTAATAPALAKPEPRDARYFYNLCTELARGKKKELALDACQKAVYLADAGGEKRTEELRLLGGKAGLEIYKLLKAQGRTEEAEEARAWGLRTAPALKKS